MLAFALAQDQMVCMLIADPLCDPHPVRRIRIQTSGRSSKHTPEADTASPQHHMRRIPGQRRYVPLISQIPLYYFKFVLVQED